MINAQLIIETTKMNPMLSMALLECYSKSLFLLISLLHSPEFVFIKKHNLASSHTEQTVHKK